MKNERKFDRHPEDGRGQKDPTQIRAVTLNGHEHDGETIVALGSDGLDRRGADSGLRGEHFIKPSDPLDIGIEASRIDDSAVADNVIDDDETAPPG